MTLKLHVDGGSKGKVVFYGKKKKLEHSPCSCYIYTVMTGEDLYFKMGIQ